MMNKAIIYISFIVRSAAALLVAGVLLTACNKLVDVPAPDTSLSSANVYNSDATAIAVLTGMYTKLSAAPYTKSLNVTSITALASESADELMPYKNVGGTLLYYYLDALTAQLAGYEIWNTAYPQIYVANSAIEGLNASTSLTPAVKQQLLGEAKFMRAFFYFYLVNLYGDVPLIMGTDYATNNLSARTPKEQVYRQIIADLQDAQKLLGANYLDATLLKTTTERTRPTQWAATALLARAYLYTGNWVGADSAASAVINKSLYSLSPLTGSNSVFIKNSSEAIWQLQPVNLGQNTIDAALFVLPATGPNSSTYPLYMNNILVNSFEAGDLRKTSWVNSVTASGITYYYPYKYKVSALNAPVTEYNMVLRLAEQYLIRAEARARQGDTSGAAADINTIRSRAGLANTTAMTQSTLLNAILHERQVELFIEWGHRWLDLKRTGNVDAVMGTPGGVCAAKGGAWSTNSQYYPIQVTELQHDPNLIQNAGY